jgi:PHD/YefM family antitoxin component YafN of YafNO toxin-antitoxin module
MIKLEDIHSLTDFQRDTKSHIKRLKKTGRPEVLTINGKASLVVQDAEAYQAMLDVIDRTEAIKGIRHGLQEANTGQGRPIREAIDDIRKKHASPSYPSRRAGAH